MDSSDSYTQDDPRHLIAGVEVMVSFLFIVTILTLVTFLIGLCRAQRLPGVLPYHHQESGQPSLPAGSVGPGLDEAALEAFPKLLYSCRTSKKIGGNIMMKFDSSTSLSCSVCLGDYDESDVIRVLPDCGHVFHLNCVDSWLRLNPTCPVCRKLPSVARVNTESCKITIDV